MALKANSLPFGVLVLALGATISACVSSDAASGRTALPEIPQQWLFEEKIPVEKDESGHAVSEASDNTAARGNSQEKYTQDLAQFNWRASFKDPQLDELIDTALAHNNDIAIAAARVKASTAALRGARSGLLPNLSLTTSAQRRADLPPGFTGSASDARVYSTNYNVGAQLDWEIDLWGRLISGTRAAYLDRAASKADFLAARLSIALNLANLWYLVVEGEQQIDLAKRDVQTGNANFSIIERRYQSGLLSSLDVRLAKASLESSKSQLAVRERQQLEFIRAIEVLLGQYPGARLEAATQLPALSEIEAVAGLEIYAGTPASLLDRRPDILSAERRLKAAGLRVTAARRALIPALQLSGTLVNPSTQSRDLFSVDAITGALTASLVQPLFLGGRLRANVAQQKAAQEIEIQNYVRTTLNAFREVEDSLSADRYLKRQEEALTASFEESVAGETLTNRQYQRGTTNIFNLINAQQRRIQTESQLLFVKQQRIANRLTLFAALGIDPEVTANSSPEAQGVAAPIDTSLVPPALPSLVRLGYKTQGDL